MKIAESAVRVCLLLLMCGSAIGQTGSEWPCLVEAMKEDPGGHTAPARVSAGVSTPMAQKKVLPNISDLKDQRLDSLVIVRVILDTKGNVRCARPEQGDADLFQRSLEAAQQWQFNPYQFRGGALVVDTYIQFRYKKNKVEVVVQADRE